MLLTTLPFDYAMLAGTGDRVRTKPGRASATRVRRAAKREKS
jgi:hypothetical protein